MRRALIGFALAACAPDWEVPRTRGSGDFPVETEPLGGAAVSPAVMRLRVRGAVTAAPLADFRLFAGSLSSSQLGRIRKRDLPGTLLEREIPCLVWGEPPDVVVAPVRALPAGVVSLATPELGLLAEVTVDPSLVPWLERTWPPPDLETGRGLSIHCGPDASAIQGVTVELAPQGLEATIRRGLDDAGRFADACVRVEPVVEVAEGSLLLPPAVVDGVGLEPKALIVTRSDPGESSCDAVESPLGPACALVGDDRVVLRASSGPSFWAVSEPGAVLGVASPGASLVLRGFEPGRAERLVATAFDLDGRASVVETTFTLAPSAIHVVINEVLSNPVGPEAAGEWIELYNDGRGAVELGGFGLIDSGGTTVLPAHELPAGGFVLLVGDDYAPDPELDLTPPAGVPIVRLPAVGTRGLSNAGEPLRLVDREGVVLSRFPALAAADPGQSLARIRVDAPDGEKGSFAVHAAPGASPGAPNTAGDS